MRLVRVATHHRATHLLNFTLSFIYLLRFHSSPSAPRNLCVLCKFLFLIDYLLLSIIILVTHLRYITRSWTPLSISRLLSVCGREILRWLLYVWCWCRYLSSGVILRRDIDATFCGRVRKVWNRKSEGSFIIHFSEEVGPFSRFAVCQKFAMHWQSS